MQVYYAGFLVKASPWRKTITCCVHLNYLWIVCCSVVEKITYSCIYSVWVGGWQYYARISILNLSFKYIQFTVYCTLGGYFYNGNMHFGNFLLYVSRSFTFMYEEKNIIHKKKPQLRECALILGTLRMLPSGSTIYLNSRTSFKYFWDSNRQKHSITKYSKSAENKRDGVSMETLEKLVQPILKCKKYYEICSIILKRDFLSLLINKYYQLLLLLNI